jgi:hypothetical protein
MAMKRDFKSSYDVANSLIPALRAATATGSSVDLQGYDSACIEFGVGTMATDGTFTCQLQESADGTTFGTVAQASLLGTFTAYGTANDPNLQRVGYIGTGRFVQVVAVFAGTGTGGIVYGNVHRSHAARQPLS